MATNTSRVSGLLQALTALQRPIKERDKRTAIKTLFCTECGYSWFPGAREDHMSTCATGIARAALREYNQTA